MKHININNTSPKLSNDLKKKKRLSISNMSLDFNGTEEENKIVNKYENQKLIEACRKGDIEKIQISIQNGANINCKDNNYGYTPLLCAVIKGHMEVVKTLISKGCNVNITSKDSWSPLHYACYNELEEIASTLIEAGADINAVISEKKSKSKRGQSCLHLAVQKNKFKISFIIN
jgi:ankyrin repeat protein